ncbi:MAG: nitrate ABC transporter permease [Leptolyngbya sp. IPPAS B-1204]|uniref:Nitrate ABC transporter permease n=1 Tax=Leptolyngbya sp. NK1-12 TaxID=2547451 RepID=A0AA97AKD7_9CYAN|nr:nitrate ABC transporter permease [Leptolyngbya sp. NK1-12]MBF2049119.1 nitrate ABC transporter permease [Elainella sp. C42_A2020_010]RNJ69282.1 MAG: nitrate ABC transporter, permease protein [Leptolyngbya sp. IPPAS B-1204]WNZ23522.1 nitrate ABC transporter permease [Leptolyngbya sp. NK1-12]
MTIAQKRPSNTASSWLRNPKVRERLDDILTPLVTILILLVIWQLLSSLPGAELPGPIQVVQDTWILILYPFYDRGGTDKGLFWQVFASLQRVAIGYSIAAVVGISMGILVGMNKRISKGLDPVFQILRTVPPLAWVPIALAALQQNQPAALFVIFITAVWPILINTSVGVKQIPQDYNNVAQVLQLPRTEYFFKILFPAALPYIFTGLRIAIGLAWLAIIAAEIVMSGIVGIGFFIWNAYQNGQVSEIILALIYIGLVGWLLDKLMAYLQNLILPQSQRQ